MNRCEQTGHEWQDRDNSAPGITEQVCINCDTCRVDGQPANPRIVIVVRGGVVTAVYAPGIPYHVEILIADLDNADTSVPGDDMPMAALADVVPLSELADIRDVANMVRAFDGEPVICEQCDNEFNHEMGFDAWHCSQTCHDRHWRK